MMRGRSVHEKIRGVNLGNWLVLEKWMTPDLFDGCSAEDETWLNRLMDKKILDKRLKEHRNTYITENDFAFLNERGINMVRIPVPYFIFGGRPPFGGCIEYLDKAFDWAEKWNMRILIDLHTVPGSQNGYDNGGICGVCSWHKHPEEVEYVLGILEKMAGRYAERKGLFGIEVLNEPISLPVYLTSPTHNKYVDKEEAKGSGFVPLRFLKHFYSQAYRRMRKYLPKDKAIVFHDGFRLKSWNRYFRMAGMENVYLDTHIYIFAMENFVPVHKPWVYALYIGIEKRKIKRVQKDVRVIVGEWCICNRYADIVKKNEEKEQGNAEQLNKNSEKELADAEQRRRYLEIARLELDAWKESAGWFYWSYQLLRDRTASPDEGWKESWDLYRCMTNGWMPEHLG